MVSAFLRVFGCSFSIFHQVIRFVDIGDVSCCNRKNGNGQFVNSVHDQMYFITKPSHGLFSQAMSSFISLRWVFTSLSASVPLRPSSSFFILSACEIREHFP